MQLYFWGNFFKKYANFDLTAEEMCISSGSFKRLFIADWEDGHAHMGCMFLQP